MFAIIRVFVLACSLWVTFILHGQYDWAIYGEVRPSELLQDSGWAYPHAAEILFDLGVIEFEKESFDIIFRRHERIKIFDSGSIGLDHIAIRYLSDDRLSKARATIYRMHKGRIKEIELNRKEINITEINSEWSVIRFRLPELQDGDIIELEYEQRYHEWRDIDRWWFQNDLPTRRSDIVLRIPEYFEFNEKNTTLIPYDVEERKVRKQGEYDLIILHRGMENIPVFEQEPFSAGLLDYKMNVLFSLSSIHIPGIMDQDYYEADHQELVRELSQGFRYGRELRNNAFLNSIIDSLGIESLTSIESVRQIFNWTRSTLDVDDRIEDRSIRAIYKTKQCNRWDADRFLIALLTQAGESAYPLLISSRNNDHRGTEELRTSSFDELVCAVRIGDRYLYLDASDRTLPFGYISPDCRFRKGLLVDAENPNWLDLTEGPSDNFQYRAELILDHFGIVQGQAQKIYTDYAAYLWRKDNSDSQDTIEVSGDEQKVIIKFLVKDSIDLRKGISMNSLLFGDSIVNPFVKEFRQQPVYFPSPFERRFIITLQLPEGSQLIDLPDIIDIGLPDGSGLFRFRVHRVGDLLIFSSQLKIDEQEYFQEEYPYLKGLYDSMDHSHSHRLSVDIRK